MLGHPRSEQTLMRTCHSMPEIATADAATHEVKLTGQTATASFCVHNTGSFVLQNQVISNGKLQEGYFWSTLAPR